VAAIDSYPSLAVVVGQFEIPQTVTAAAFAAARRRGITTILNPAPAEPLSHELLAGTDWLIPNEVEFEAITGHRPDDEARVDLAADSATRLVVTLGGEGAAIVDRSGAVVRFPAIDVDAVDTTGAGDAFVGAFAFGLAARLDETVAVRLGILAAADSVTRAGTQASFPDEGRCAEMLAEVAAG
jgi:ribokinase